MPPLPWFKYYPNDFFNDPNVARMTLEEIGMYHLMLRWAWNEDPPGSLPGDIETLSKILQKRPQVVRRLMSGVLGNCWKTSTKPPENPEKTGRFSESFREFILRKPNVWPERIYNQRLTKEAQIQQSMSEGGRKGANITNTAYATAKANAPAPAIQNQISESDSEKEESKSKSLSHASNGNRPQQATEWPAELLEIKTDLESLEVLDWFDDPKYWKRIDMEFEPIPYLAYLDELKSYVNWITTQPKTRQRRDHKRGFRNWLAKAKRMKENDAQRQAVRNRRG